MRIFVKFFLIVATASVMIFSYKFVIVSDGVKTALSYSNLHFNEYDAAKKNEVISDVEKIYTYRAFGRQFYISKPDTTVFCWKASARTNFPARRSCITGWIRRWTGWTKLP